MDNETKKSHINVHVWGFSKHYRWTCICKLRSIWESSTPLCVGHARLSITTAGFARFMLITWVVNHFEAMCMNSDMTNLPPLLLSHGLLLPKLLGPTQRAFKFDFSVFCTICTSHQEIRCFALADHMSLDVPESAIWMRWPDQCSWAFLSMLWMQDIW